MTSARVVLYTREECSHCDEALKLLRSLSAAHGFRWDSVDVDSDPALAARFGDRVPVVLVGCEAGEVELAVAGMDAASATTALRAALG